MRHSNSSIVCGMQGIGLEVLTGIFQAVQPTHVVMLQTGNPAKDLPATPFWAEPRACTSAAVLPLPAVVASDSQSPGTCLLCPCGVASLQLQGPWLADW